MFGGIKDSLTSVAAKSLLASRIERYGKLLDLHISSREKSLSAELLLEGEEVPVKIHVRRYKITAKDGENYLTVESVVASRPWLQNLLEDLLVDKPLPIPALALLALGKADS